MLKVSKIMQNKILVGRLLSKKTTKIRSKNVSNLKNSERSRCLHSGHFLILTPKIREKALN